MLRRPRPAELANLRQSDKSTPSSSSRESSAHLAPPPPPHTSQSSKSDSSSPAASSPAPPSAPSRPPSSNDGMRGLGRPNLRLKTLANRFASTSTSTAALTDDPAGGDTSSGDDSSDEWKPEDELDDNRKKKKAKKASSSDSTSEDWDSTSGPARRNRSENGDGDDDEDEERWSGRPERVELGPGMKLLCPWPGCRQGRNNGFSTPGHLARHKRLHTGEKDYRCTHRGCDAAFARRDNLTQHLKCHNKDPDFNSSGKRRTTRRARSATASVPSATKSYSRSSSLLSLPPPPPSIKLSPSSYQESFSFDVNDSKPIPEKEDYQERKRYRDEPRVAMLEEMVRNEVAQRVKLEAEMAALHNFSAYQDGLRRDSNDPPFFIPNPAYLQYQQQRQQQQQQQPYDPRRAGLDPPPRHSSPYTLNPYNQYYPPRPDAQTPLHQTIYPHNTSSSRSRSHSSEGSRSRAYAPYARSEYEPASALKKRSEYTSLADQFSDGGAPSPGSSSRGRSYSTSSVDSNAAFSPDTPLESPNAMSSSPATSGVGGGNGGTNSSPTSQSLSSSFSSPEDAEIHSPLTSPEQDHRHHHQQVDMVVSPLQLHQHPSGIAWLDAYKSSSSSGVVEPRDQSPSGLPLASVSITDQNRSTHSSPYQNSHGYLSPLPSGSSFQHQQPPLFAPFNRLQARQEARVYTPPPSWGTFNPISLSHPNSSERMNEDQVEVESSKEDQDATMSSPPPLSKIRTSASMGLGLLFESPSSDIEAEVEVDRSPTPSHRRLLPSLSSSSSVDLPSSLSTSATSGMPALISTGPIPHSSNSQPSLNPNPNTITNSNRAQLPPVSSLHLPPHLAYQRLSTASPSPSPGGMRPIQPRSQYVHNNSSWGSESTTGGTLYQHPYQNQYGYGYGFGYPYGRERVGGGAAPGKFDFVSGNGNESGSGSENGLDRRMMTIGEGSGSGSEPFVFGAAQRS